MNNRVTLVVPSIRESSLLPFLNAWNSQWESHPFSQIIIVEDNPEKTFQITPDDRNRISHYSWKEIDEMLGEKSWIISRRDAAIRNFGFWLAWKNEAEYIISLDDDCLPVRPDFNLVEDHVASLTNVSRWCGSILGQRVRGLPYRNQGTFTNVVLNHGLWMGEPDFDAIQTLSGESEDIELPKHNRLLAQGQYYPMCFLPDQLVTKHDGTVNSINNISVGDQVITDGNEVHEVKAVLEREIEEDVVEIKISGRKQPMIVTSNHEIRTQDGWKRSSAIKVNDQLAFPRMVFTERTLSDEEMYAIGLFIAEGSFGKSKKMKCKIHGFTGIVFSFHVDEQKTLGKFVKKFLLEKFKKHSSEYIKGKSYKVECYGKDLAMWFYKYCGEYCQHKTINQNIVRSSNINKLLTGLFDGDGHIGLNRNRPCCSLKTTSLNLANQVKYVINTLGYYCSINTHKQKKRKIAYKLSMYGENAAEFISNVLNQKTIYPPAKKTKPIVTFSKDENYIYFSVQRIINYKYCGTVYNLNISDNHTYLANDCVVKNCGMNICFKREITPLMYFALMGEGYPYKRFEDIWCGVISKKVCDHLGLLISVGRPFVFHSRASDPFVNLAKEAPGVGANETFWEKVDNIELSGKTPCDCMLEIGEGLKQDDDDYVQKLGEAIIVWAQLFSSNE